MSSTRQPVRTGHDEYQTPKWCVEQLLTRIRPFGHFLEPCRGAGNIVEVIRPLVDTVEWCEINEGRDFLQFKPLRRYDWVITNPPFTHALAFLEKSLDIAENVAFLLRLNFLGSKKRKPFWNEHPPQALFVLSQRPSFTGHGTDSIEYAWFVWSLTTRHGVFVL